MCEIREAAMKDLNTILDLGLLMHRESNYAANTIYNTNIFGAFVTRLIEGDHGFVHLALKDGQPIGFMLASLVPFFFGPGLMSSEICTFIKKENRGGTAGIQLIHEYEKWAKGNGAIHICIGTSTGVASERVSRFYESMGFRKVGAAHRMEV